MGQRARAVADLARGNPFLGIALGRWPESENRPRVAVPLGSRRRRRTAGSRTTAPQPTRPVGLAGSLLTAHEGPANAWCECAVRVDQSIDVLPRGDPPPEGSAASGSSASAEIMKSPGLAAAVVDRDRGLDAAGRGRGRGFSSDLPGERDHVAGQCPTGVQIVDGDVSLCGVQCARAAGDRDCEPLAVGG